MGTNNDFVNIEAERQAVLTAVYNDMERDTLLSRDNIDGGCFTDSLASQTYKWLVDKYNQGQKISLIRLDDETNLDTEKLTDAGIRDFDFDDLLNILIKLKIRRQLAKGAKKIFKLVKQPDLIVEDYESKAQEIIFDLTYHPQKKQGKYTIQEILDLFYDQVMRIEQGEKKISGLPTGFLDIDIRCKGLHDGQVTTIAAPTHRGKTSLALNILLNVLKLEKKAVLFSLEMTATEIATKLISLESHVPTNAYQRHLKEFEKKNMDASLSRLMKLNLTTFDKNNMSASNMKAECRKIVKQDNELDLVVIDYLQNMKYSPGENEEKRIGQTVLDIKNMAGELSVPIVLISQMNRKVNGKPKMSQTRGSGRIEEISDNVWLLFRPEFEKGKKLEKEEAKLIIEKGRTTGGGVVDMYFYPEIQAWRDEKHEPLKIIKE